MNSKAESSLAALRTDFEGITGTPFAHFYCPILFRDEPVELCRGHVVNKAFPAIPRQWTIQRADVDGFFGTYFESEFVDIQYRGTLTADKGLFYKRLWKKFRPQILAKGSRISYYSAADDSAVPSGQSAIQIETPHGTASLRLQLSRDQIEATQATDWEIRIEKDMRLPALVSLLKSAHLTLFRMLGYRYVLSASGHFLGWSILGKFFATQHGTDKEQVLTAARSHFRDFSNLVRPVLSHTPELRGSVTDNQLYVLETVDSKPWGFMIFIQTTNETHAVITPIFEDKDGIARFMSFLKGDGGRVSGRFARYEDGQFKAWPKVTSFDWPPGAFA